MKTLIIGMGEVGTAHYNLLGKCYANEVHHRDIEEKGGLLQQYDNLIITIRYTNFADFVGVVKDYEAQYKPLRVMILSTVPPGTCESLGTYYCHSTTRGVHPNLEHGLLTITKHIGGRDAPFWVSYFMRAGIDCIAHTHAKTTELAHILNNCAYGVSLMLADELQKLCRAYGVNYYEAVMQYTHTNNIGWMNFGDSSKVRYILTPPNGKIGGHCVTMSANLIDKDKQTEMIGRLAKYGNT